LQRALPMGQLLVEADRLFVGCGAGNALQLLEVQPEGKKRMPARDFVHGYRPSTGERLGA
jgi:methionyl-tRNA formyltransferase